MSSLDTNISRWEAQYGPGEVGVIDSATGRALSILQRAGNKLFFVVVGAVVIVVVVAVVVYELAENVLVWFNNQ